MRGGQGERRFFRVCMKWLANKHTDVAARNMKYVSEFGRWDDLYLFMGTRLEKEAFELMKEQFYLDLVSKTPSLLGKWLKSENTSSAESRKLATMTRVAFGLSPRQYRKSLSLLRERIKVVERLMSTGRWDEIEFDKIPSKAGLVYRNAFARRDIIKAKYEAFAKNEKTTVNAKSLYPYEVVRQALGAAHYSFDNVNRLMVNKYWENLADYFKGATLNALAVVDTSGSMTWGGAGVKPIDVAVSLGLYCAERAKGPFANHYISFSSKPQLIETKGVDFCDKVQRIVKTNLCENTDIEATFDMILNTARRYNCAQRDLPENIIIISDMEFDAARGSRYGYYNAADYARTTSTRTLMENIERKWNRYGYQMPKLIFWNVDARNDNIPMTVKDGVSFVSGFSPVLFEQIIKGKTAFDLMYDKLDSERYACIK